LPSFDPLHSLKKKKKTGTDYSRSLPLVGPRKIIDMFPRLSQYMVQIITDQNTAIPSVPSMVQVLVFAIYRKHFEKFRDKVGLFCLLRFKYMIRRN
jgi:hypothetical protein